MTEEINSKNEDRSMKTSKIKISKICGIISNCVMCIIDKLWCKKNKENTPA